MRPGALSRALKALIPTLAASLVLAAMIAVPTLAGEVEIRRLTPEEADAVRAGSIPARTTLPTKLTQPGPVLILPYYSFDPDNPAGPTTLFAVRNGSDSAQRIRLDVFDASSVSSSFSQEIDLEVRETRTFNVRDFPDATPTGWASVTVIDPETGGPLFGVAGLSGDFFRLDPSNNFAGGGVLLSQDPDPVMPLAARRVPGLESDSNKVANGILTGGIPAVGALLFDDVLGLTTTCTATLVGCRTVLTAARCVNEIEDPDLLRVYFQHGGIFEIDGIEVHPDADPASASHDIALLRLSRAVNGISPIPINTAGRFGNNSSLDLVGFGSTAAANDDGGLKRIGAVRTRGCGGAAPGDLNLCWAFNAPLDPPGDEVGRCIGDGGAPLIGNIDGLPVVAGVTGTGVSASCEPDDLAWAADTFVEREWIEGAGGSDLLNQSCGFLPQVGEPGVSVGTGIIELTPGAGSQDDLSFGLLPDTSLLRITVNASGDNDVDFFAAAGRVPTFADHDCEAFRGGAFEHCEIVNPEISEWNLLFDLFRGEGTQGQLTVTLFAQPDAALPGLCERWDLRFFNGGAFDGGTDFTFFVPGNPDDGEPFVLGDVYNEAGDLVNSFGLTSGDVAFEINSRDLDAQLAEGLGANFGTVEWRFFNGLEGNVSGTFRASGRFSVGVEAVCVDNLGR